MARAWTGTNRGGQISPFFADGRSWEMSSRSGDACDESHRQRGRRILTISQEHLRMNTAKNYAQCPQRAAMSRMLVWIAQRDFLGFGCSECGWRFEPSGAPVGTSFDEMICHFEFQRDLEFLSHVCAD